MYVWAKAGVSLPHSSAMQISAGSRVSRSELRPGDLVFFYSPIHHVGISVGDGIMIHAPQPGDVVRYATIASQPFAPSTEDVALADARGGPGNVPRPTRHSGRSAPATP